MAKRREDYEGPGAWGRNSAKEIEEARKRRKEFDARQKSGVRETPDYRGFLSDSQGISLKWELETERKKILLEQYFPIQFKKQMQEYGLAKIGKVFSRFLETAKGKTKK